MPETIIESVLKGKIPHDVLIKWLNDEKIEDTPECTPLLCCSRTEFVAYFLSFLRTQTESILQTNTNALSIIHQNTPEKLLNSNRKHRRSCSDPTSDPKADNSAESLSVKTDRHRSHESPNRDRSSSKKPGRRVKTKLFSNEDRSNQCPNFSSSLKTDSDESKLSTGMERIAISSTPMKNGISPAEYSNLLVTSPLTPQSRSFPREPHERCDTPRSNHRHFKSQEKSNFGDFLIIAQPAKSSKKKRTTPKNISIESENADNCVKLDLSNSEIFPEIGARKATSLWSEKRRIKPTNIDTSTTRKSFSLNSFNSDAFQQPSPLALEDNVAFKYQSIQPKEFANSFEAERSILKQERHKLMEKFNVMNTSSVPMTPVIKLSNKDFTERQINLVDADATKVLLKDTLDLVIKIYELIITNNLILSVTNEVYFLISILLSKQYEEDYHNTHTKLSQETVSEYLLKTIHNGTYFAVKSLWHQRHILEFMLDKPSLKILGENKKVRSFYPELAKFLLNLYGIKCESDTGKDDKVIVLEHRYNNGMVCFNSETDNAENFPSLLSFQNFKKQRDMFYEILRWYTESQQSGVARTTFRSRVKALLSLSVAPANAAHLARLYTAHMLAECLPSDQQESKLSKLQRRFTGPTGHESQRLPKFSHKELFYKEFVMYAESESFRVHLRDCLASELCQLNASAVGSTDDRGNSKPAILSRSYLNLLLKLRLISKMLGFLVALPYSRTAVEFTLRTGHLSAHNSAQPNEKVLGNELAMRQHSQPSIDLKGILTEANEKWRLCVTVPWIVQYLSMLDYTSLRIDYHQSLLKMLFEIYTDKLNEHAETAMKKSTVIFLKLTLGWLFDLPHFPRDFFYELPSSRSKMASKMADEESLDSLELIDDSILFEACPFLRDINVLLVTSKPTSDVKDCGSFRHITPVTMTLNAEDRMRSKEKEIQARLEEAFLKSQPSSTRRVLELVAERVTSRGLRLLQPQQREARRRARRELAGGVARGGSASELASLGRAIYQRHLEQLRSCALTATRRHAAERVKAALAALLPPGGDQTPLEALAARLCYRRTQHWIQHNWDSIDVLCKDIEGEIKNLQVLGEAALSDEGSKHGPATDAMLAPAEDFQRVNVSPSAAIIELKELICVLLEYEEPEDPTLTLRRCRLAASRHNVFTRPPAQRALLQLTLDLCLVFASRKPKEVTESFLGLAHAVWNECCPDRKRRPSEPDASGRPEPSPEPRNFDQDDRVPTPVSDEEPNPDVSAQPEKYLSEQSSGHNKLVGQFSEQSLPGTSSVQINLTGQLGGFNTLPVQSDNSPSWSQGFTSQPMFFGTQNISNLSASSNSTSPSTLQHNQANVSGYSLGSLSPKCSNSCQPTFAPSTVPVQTDSRVEESNEFLEYFDRVLCPRNIVLLSESRCDARDVWTAVAALLVFLVRMAYLSEDSLTEQCLAVFRQDWPQHVLSSLSRCMQCVADSGGGGRFRLFLQLMAEFCVDME